MEPRKSMLMPISITVLITAVIFGVGGYYLASGQLGTDTDTSAGVLTTPAAKTSASPKATATPTASTDKTYTNTKLNYSFKYPADLTPMSFVGQGTEAALTADADDVVVNKNGLLFEVADASVTTINDAFTTQATINATKTATTVDGVTANKYTTTLQTFYVVKNGADSVIKITVANNNTQAVAMFASFDFTK